MNNYVVAYLDMQNAYQIKFISAEDPITALRRTIPKFVKVLEYIKTQQLEVSYENLYTYISHIDISTFSIIQVPELSTASNIRMQILSIYDIAHNTLTLLYTKKQSQLDALYSTLTEMYNVEQTDFLLELYNNKDIRGIIMYFSNLTGLRVYTVSTLRQLVKESIKK